MTRAQRLWHARIWSGLSLLLALALSLALFRRHAVESQLRPDHTQRSAP
jgi:hypothetical protein